MGHSQIKHTGLLHTSFVEEMLIYPVNFATQRSVFHNGELLMTLHWKEHCRCSTECVSWLVLCMVTVFCSDLSDGMCFL